MDRYQGRRPGSVSPRVAAAGERQQSARLEINSIERPRRHSESTDRVDGLLLRSERRLRNSVLTALSGRDGVAIRDPGRGWSFQHRRLVGLR